MSKVMLSKLLNQKFPTTDFIWIGSDVFNDRQRFVIDYKNGDTVKIREFVKSILPNIEVYYYDKTYE
jgi:hypothetical protein